MRMPIPPGVFIKESMELQKVSLEDMSLKMNMTKTELNSLLNGFTVLNETIAEQLETVLGVPKEFWLQQEAIYQQRLSQLN